MSDQKLQALIAIANIDFQKEFNLILGEIIGIVCKAAGAHSGTIMLYDEAKKELKIVAQYGLPDDYPQQVEKLAKAAGVVISSSPSGIVLATGRYYAVPDVFAEPRHKSTPWIGLAVKYRFRAQLYTPILHDGRVVGLLNVYMDDVHEFTEDEINFKTVAAGQASAVIHNAILNDEIRRRIQENNDQKAFEVKLKESERKYRELFYDSTDALFITNPQDIFIAINRAGAELFDITPEKMIGTSISQWLTPESIERINIRKALRREGKKVPPIFIVETNDGKYFEIRTSVVRWDGRGIEICGLARDITGIQKLKGQIKENDIRKQTFEYLVKSSRGGNTRTLILEYIGSKSYNASQIATALKLDYKTVRGHLKILIENGIVGKISGTHDLYFIK